MRPYAPERVRAVLEALGVTPEQAAAAEDRWFGGNRPENSGNARKEPTWSIANLQRVLGPPVVEEPSDRLRAGGRLARWAMPLWPDLQFEVLEAPSGWLWGSLMQAPGVPRPAPGTVEDLTPWSCTLRELWGRFRALRHSAEYTDAMLEVVAFRAPDRAGRVARYQATFVWGLLQVVWFAEPMDVGPTPQELVDGGVPLVGAGAPRLDHSSFGSYLWRVLPESRPLIQDLEFEEPDPGVGPYVTDVFLGVFEQALAAGDDRLIARCFGIVEAMLGGSHRLLADYVDWYVTPELLEAQWEGPARRWAGPLLRRQLAELSEDSTWQFPVLNDQ